MPFFPPLLPRPTIIPQAITYLSVHHALAIPVPHEPYTPYTQAVTPIKLVGNAANTRRTAHTTSPHIKSAEYENPRNSSCMACVNTIKQLAMNQTSLFQQSPLTGLDRSKHGCNAGKFRIKVARIRRILYFWLERWWDFLIANIVPVNVSEECMAHDFLCICRSRAKP